MELESTAVFRLCDEKKFDVVSTPKAPLNAMTFEPPFEVPPMTLLAVSTPRARPTSATATTA